MATFLQTDRLILRNLSPDDLDTLYLYRNNADCIGTMLTVHDISTGKTLPESISEILFKSFISLFFFPKSRNSTTPSA